LKKNIILIVNPIAGNVDKSEMITATENFAKSKGFDCILYETTGKKDCATLRKLYKEYLPERIIVAGGDGTVKMVAEAVEDYDVILGILPAGSANGLAVDLNLPSSIEENLEIAFNDNCIAMDMICINGIKSLHLSDLGLNAQLVKNYENSSTRGMLGYALQAITTLSEKEVPFKATISANGQTKTTMAQMVVIANSQKYGTGVTINPNGIMNDGKFEIVILRNLDLLVFGKIVTGNIPLDSDDVEIISTDCATITTNVPISFQIDGEYIGRKRKLNISILPGQMKVAIP